MLEREGQLRWWDEETIDGLSTKSLDQEDLRSFYQNIWTETQLVADRILSISPTGGERITASGVLFFHPKSNDVLPQAEL